MTDKKNVFIKTSMKGPAKASMKGPMKVSMKGRLFSIWLTSCLAVLIFAGCAKQFPTTDNVVKLVIDSIVPAQGAAGQPVLIYGSGFSALPGGNKIYFNGLLAQSDTVASFQSLRVFAPAGGTTGNVTVAANRDSAKGPVFTYIPAPVISDVVYNRVFIITGQNFDAHESVVTISGQVFPGFAFSAQAGPQTLSVPSLTLNDQIDNPAPVVVSVRNVPSNVFPYLFYPQINNFASDTAHPNKPFTLYGMLFGRRTVPSTLRAFFYDANQRKTYMTPDPTIISWTTNTIQVTIPNYNNYLPVVAVVNVISINLEVAVSTNSTSRGLIYYKF